MISTAYFDASGKKESAVVVVAGFQAHNFSWMKFEAEWKRCLAIYGVAELHMKNYAHSVGEYASWKGNQRLRSRYLTDLIRIIAERVDNSFAVAVHMHEYREVDQVYRLKESAHPYALCGLHCLDKVVTWAKNFKHDPMTIDYVFEDGDEGKGNLFQLASTRLSINPVFKGKGHSVAFQAADLIAYEHGKANQKIIEFGDGAVGVEELRIPMQKLISIPGSAEWSVVEKADLVKNCERLDIPKRPLASNALDKGKRT